MARNLTGGGYTAASVSAQASIPEGSGRARWLSSIPSSKRAGHYSGDVFRLHPAFAFVLATYLPICGWISEVRLIPLCVSLHAAAYLISPVFPGCHAIYPEAHGRV